jgi:Ca2+/H+ antiporter
MDITLVSQLAGLAIVSAMVSGLVQLIKSSLETRPLVTQALVIGLSLLVGGIYYVIQDTQFLTTSLIVLGFANTVYLYLIKPFQK